MTLRSCALAVAVALSLAGCSDGPLPVTATRVLEVAGLRAVVNAVALSPDGSLVVVGDMDGDLIAREVPAGAERWKGPALTLRGSVSMASSLEAMAPVSLALNRDGTRAAANGILGQVHVMNVAKEREERTFANTAQAPGHGLHGEMRYSLAFTEDGDWLFAPDTHDRGLRILHVPGGKGFSVLRGEGPFYKAMALALGASMVALLRPGDTEGRGPYGVEVWRLTYRAK